MAGRSGGSHIRLLVQWLVIGALAIIALIYFSVPSRSQDRPGWSAQLWAMEGGEELVAAVESYTPEEEAYAPTLVVICGFRLRYDPGPQVDPAADWTGRSATLVFNFGAETIERDARYEAMDGMFALPLAASDRLLAAIRSGTQVIVTAVPGDLPENVFSLAGSTAAIAEMQRSC